MKSFLLIAAILIAACSYSDACDRSGSSAATSQGVVNINNVIGGGQSGGNDRFAGELDIFGKRGRTRMSATGRAAFQLSNRGKAKKLFKR